MTGAVSMTERLKDNNPHIVVLDVGHGNATFVHENGATVLIDTATKSHVLEYLRGRSINEIDLVVLSHSDVDHIGGLAGLLVAGIKIKAVKVNSDAKKDSEAWRDLIFALEDARRSGDLKFEVGLSTGTLYIECFSRCRADVVAPTPGLAALGVGALDRGGRKITSNSISACVRIFFDGSPIALVSGDMDEIALDDAINADTDLSAQVLVFPHHGGLPGPGNPSTFTAKLMARVNPKTVLFSLGRSRYETPRPEIIDVVKQQGARIACTQLSTRCSEQLSASPPNHLSSFYAAGAATGACCAGSIVLHAYEAADVRLTTQDAHNVFVKSVVSPLCRLEALT